MNAIAIFESDTLVRTPARPFVVGDHCADCRKPLADGEERHCANCADLALHSGECRHCGQLLRDADLPNEACVDCIA